MKIDKKNHSIGIFIDLSKAFDIIDHVLLCQKLEYYGIRGIALDWFTNYLSNRKQFVNLNGKDSSLLTVLCGVPQGSILGPLLFLIYINDIVYTFEQTKFIIFADDTNLFYKHKNLNTLVSIINTELIKISSWFKLNKLSLNISKTNFIHFSLVTHFVTKIKKLIYLLITQKLLESPTPNS